MLLSKKHMERFVDIADLDAHNIAEILTQAGHEVEGYNSILTGTNLVVGHVLTCEKHPDADTLNITTVDLGDRVEQIVCGAANIAKGQYVVVAQNGTVLKEMTIKPTSIRGVESNGMICSFDELDLAPKFQPDDQKDGIIVLPETAPGTPAFEALGLDDIVFDVSQTPNRSDMMALRNAALELGALLDRPVVLPIESDITTHEQTDVSVTLDTERAPYFLLKKVNGLRVAPSPLWLRGLLIASGIKPINNLVDISNLVMLETGNPIHFYDANKVGRNFSVRDGFEGDVVALDDKTYTLQAQDLVIFDGDTPVGIAGIMGLGNSTVDETTTSILIEAARFDFPSVRKTASRLGLSTDASVRFSKPMDATSTDQAMARAVSLLNEMFTDAEFEKTAVAGASVAKATHISVSVDKVNQLLGTTFSMEQVVDVFDRLYLEPVVQGNQIETTIPSARLDLTIAEDLIEEVIRVLGFDALPETMPELPETVGSLSEQQLKTQLVENTLLALGAHQAITYTLTAKTNDQSIDLMNPISEKRASLRTSLFDSLLNALKYNHSYQNKNVWLFEISKIYAVNQTSYMLGMIGSGAIYPDNWTQTRLHVDFYAFKGALETVLDTLGFAKARVQFVASETPSDGFHPYQSADILINRKRIGVVATLHPNTGQGVYAELDLGALFEMKSGKIKAQELSKFPQVTQDISIMMDRDLSFAALEQTILKVGKRDIVNIDVFDIFYPKDDETKQSVALTLTLAQHQTYSMEEVHDIMNRIKEALVSNHNVVIR